MSKTEKKISEINSAAWEIRPGVRYVKQIGNFFLQEDDNIFNNIIFLYHLGYVITEYILSHNEVQNLINSNETFDLVIVEQFANEAHMGFAQHFNSPLITFSSLGHSEWTSHLVGNIKLPSIEPILFTSYTNRMSFVQRLSNSILNLFDIFYKHFIAMPKQQELLDKYFPSKLTLQEIMYNTSLLLMNSHSSTSHPTMLTTSVIEIGGFHITSNKLPVDIQKFLDESKEGAIFFSMGSNLKTTDLSNNTLSGILNVFSNMKQNVLWKFDGDSISNKPKNVLISKWLPQSDILAHPYTVGFITHGGMLSTTEAIFYGVPMVGIPIFGDQKLNVARSVEKGIAVHLPFKKLSETTLTEALVEILDNPKYKKNSKKLSSILRDRVVKPLDLAMYWVEYIGRHNGNPYSKNSALELYWFQLYLLDARGLVETICKSLFLPLSALLPGPSSGEIREPAIAKCSRILGVFPFAGRSHYILGNSLMRGLAEAGHDVTVISPFEDKNPPKNGSYNNIVLTGFYEELAAIQKQRNMFQMNTQSLIMRIFMQRMLLPMNAKTLEHPNVQDLIKSGTEFDVIILEQFMTDGLKIFGHIFRAPTILFNSVGPCMWVNNIVGNPSPLAYVPHILQTYSSNMSFFERVDNVLSYLLDNMINHFYTFPSLDALLKKIVPNSPNFYELYHNVSLVLLNSHESLNQPVPLVPNMIEIGGFHVKPPKKLPQDLQDYLDSAKEGVVYFSMGSNIKSINFPPERRDMFLRIFRKLRQKVLWKFEDDNLPGLPANVKIGKWLPQQDILAHPNVKVFITHGGMLSSIETVYHGVPILAIPVAADQPQNAKMATNNGYALSLPYHDPDFSEEKLSNLLNELLNNSKYRDNVRKRSKLFHDRPMKPMESAVYWIEYVIRNGGASHLMVAGVGLPWYKYHLVDVVSFILGVAVLLLGLVFVGKSDMKFVVALFPLLINVSVVKCSRILVVFPTPAKSHYILGNSLARAFSRGRTRCHNVRSTIGHKITNSTLHHPSFQNLLKSGQHFDVVIIEQFNNDGLKALAHYYNAPLIVFSTVGANTWVNPLVGNPSPPSYIPEMFLSYSNNMTFWQRLVNFLFFVVSELYKQLVFLPEQNRLMKEVFPDVPDLSTLYYNVSLVLVNSHESTNQPVPHVPNMIDIGGFHIQPAKVLPKELKDFMDNATDGVVYFSMGSNIKPSQMTKAKMDGILRSFGKLKQKVLWKWDEDSLPGKPDNVMISKWFPQQDILGRYTQLQNRSEQLMKDIGIQGEIETHHNTKLFVTHGGLLSTTETVYHGVPVLALPIFGDQKVNAARAQLIGLGISLSYSEFTEEQFSEALRMLLENQKYSENAKRRSKLLHDRPVKPKDLAVYWTEYIIRHNGAPHLRVAALDLPLYKYLFLFQNNTFLTQVACASSQFDYEFVGCGIIFVSYDYFHYSPNPNTEYVLKLLRIARLSPECVVQTADQIGFRLWAGKTPALRPPDGPIVHPLSKEIFSQVCPSFWQKVKASWAEYS
ncbi:hypothetical protein NQ317_005132 [Molorchus minor]|uniref:Uncharacterized protein n=1 Tax=Molorchus minor TaxID=1323400 RepID=A0ABQ9JRS0_9CUCU|nr:hypothetical protein NQ317_005132 [Molorchus minor]